MTQTPPIKILFSSNISWSIYNFRFSLLKYFQSKGYIIYTIAHKDKYAKYLDDEGFHFHHIDINNNSTNPIGDFKLILDYIKLYKQISPNIILHNAIKPNIYGTIAAQYLGIPVINNISGLGTLFIKNSFFTKIAKYLYKFSQNKASKVLFQNHEDLDLFIENGLVKKELTELVPGSGVDTNFFSPIDNKRKNSLFEFIFVARLIADKGIREFIEAIRIIRSKNYRVKFTILGSIYEANSTAITQQELKDWINELHINYIPHSDNVRDIMKYADCLVLPSYREGLSRVLIEASSLAIPMITTKVPGCKDVVINNVNGLLCEVKNSKDLAEKMELMLNMDEGELLRMGLNARKRAVDVFDIKKIVAVYENCVKEILSI
ncbi:glycosyltransferase family 4 protein [Leadbetterella sp. DM7]|uniref:glycosyltransferase family 4 protein n=1 Tax=Leadbetterella sp. DM7 TaxID=3235085 RepID=UPI00349E7F3E